MDDFESKSEQIWPFTKNNHINCNLFWNILHREPFQVFMQNFTITANILSSLWILKIEKIEKFYINQIYFGIKSGSVLDGELYTRGF